MRMWNFNADVLLFDSHVHAHSEAEKDHTGMFYIFYV